MTGIAVHTGWFVIVAIAALASVSAYALLLRHRLNRTDSSLREALRLLEETRSEIKHAAGIDGLTGIHNRSVFDATLQREWTRARRERRPLAVLMVDIDHFKHHNDTYGHLAGDECLRQVAAALTLCVQRTTDVVTRYGGEEFGVILPGTDPVGATAVAERMRLAVEAIRLPHVSRPTGRDVTISVGVAVTVPVSAMSPKDLVAAADAALYTAKAVGRNQVILSDAERTLASV